jgi:hypothetical protein
MELVMVRGRTADGAMLDRFVAATRASADEYPWRLHEIVDAVLRTRATAIAHGYDVAMVGVACDGTDTPPPALLIDALRGAGLHNVTAMDSAGPRQLFSKASDSNSTVRSVTAPQEDDVRLVDVKPARESSDRGRHRRPSDSPRVRRRLAFLAAGVIGLAAFATVFGVEVAAEHGGRPSPPTPMPAAPPVPGNPVIRHPEAVDSPVPLSPAHDSSVPDAPAPVDAPRPRQTPEQDGLPTQSPPERQQHHARPSPPSATPGDQTPEPPIDPPAPPALPSPDCLLFCGVAI